MAMTKAERAALELAQHEARLARALRFPTDDVPKPMTHDEIKAACAHEVTSRYGRGTEKVARGWFFNSHGMQVSHGCSDGHSHARDGESISTQGMGRMYRTKLEALRAMRHEKVRDVATVLAAIDAQIENENSK